VVEVVHDAGAIVKVILETCLLTVEEKLRASELAIAAGADFIKTSTGFSTGGATPEDVALMRGVAGGRCGVKASGGIRTLADAKRMLEAGANRIGVSASVAIVGELKTA
jgi:deoxyribose-phosphate aldolase